MEISSTENSYATTNWLFDYELMDDISAVSEAAGFPSLPLQPLATATTAFGFSLAHKAFICSSNVSLKPESCNTSGSKACREKFRRDRLNERFLELRSILEPGKPPKTDKCAILCDAIQMVTQLRLEAQQLKESNKDLLEKIKELKVEKNELRDEKLRLKASKEKLELQIKASAAQPALLAHHSAMGVAFAKEAGNKLVPFFGYPGVAMWQFMQPAVVDTSQDHVLRPPVA
ncbi:transcription factor ILR3-like isoform X2 [Olea europaea var. sylvestris]|uniref:transcription factor ILR3-like isoform X2 n=1 Tax=Olea europaea var. sylvestris TaxID=158386 RepID=UPI000C1D66C8|nr:transcription factor ILR3-like isoform X2 [Olea europaea var. sylvestris]